MRELENVEGNAFATLARELMSSDHLSMMVSKDSKSRRSLPMI